MPSPPRKDLPPERTGVPEPPAAPPPVGQLLYSARQPILDGESRVYGYEILFRGGPENRYTATDADLASALTLEQSAAAFGLDQLVGDRLAFVNLSRGALLGEYHRVLPPDRVVIELLESIAPEPEVLAACRRLRAQGYTLALDDYAGSPAAEPFLGLVDIVKVDLRLWPEGLDPRALAPLRRDGLRLLAEKVETHEERKAALEAGYDLFQGYFFCRPQMVAVRDLPPSKLSVLRFMAEVSAPTTSMERIEELFRADVALTVRLLRYLNSASFGWRHEVQSIHHALELMGEQPLRRWAMMLGMMVLCDDRPHELLITALSRARFAERISPSAGIAEHGQELFLAGMLSLVDAMVGRPLHEILNGLALPEAVRDAVLQRESELRPVLELVAAYQRGNWRDVAAARERCPVDDLVLGEAYLDSLDWAESTAL